MQLLAEKRVQESNHREKPNGDNHQAESCSTQSRFQKANFVTTATSNRGVGLGWRASPQHPTHTLGVGATSQLGQLSPNTVPVNFSCLRCSIALITQRLAGKSLNPAKQGWKPASPLDGLVVGHLPCLGRESTEPEIARLHPALEPSTPDLQHIPSHSHCHKLRSLYPYEQKYHIFRE